MEHHVSILEQEFCAQLHEARRIGTDDLAEVGTADVAVDGLRSEKLGVIKNVKSLSRNWSDFDSVRRTFLSNAMS